VRRAILIAALGVLLALHASAAAQQQVEVGGGHGGHPGETAAASILFGSFEPGHNDVVAGDAVTWTNTSVRRHTVSSAGGDWSSGDLFGGDSFTHTFAAPGAYAYYCEVHPFMRGEVDVHDLLLSTPREPAAPNRPYSLRGRSALASGTPVTIESDAGAGYAPVAQTTVGDDGSFSASIRPRAAEQLRAVAAAETSPSVQLLVLDRKVAASGRTRRGGRATVTTRVLPASPGATVVLQLRLREHFGWWPVGRAKLDHAGRAAFHLKVPGRVRARVVLTLSDGATPLAVGPTLLLGR
jgi:plastocyanin